MEEYREEKLLLEDYGYLESEQTQPSLQGYKSGQIFPQLTSKPSRLPVLPQRSWSSKLATTAIFYLVGFLSGVVVFQSFGPTCSPHNVSYSPAKRAVMFKKLSYSWPSSDNTYFGPPTLHQTKAWENLLDPVMIQASYEDMALAGENPDASVELSSGGYLASLGVYHDLHCLRRIRFYIYKDHFYSNMTSQQKLHEGEHIEHCLEKLRISTMCTGDIGLYTFSWKPNVPKPITKSSTIRNCVNWDKLDSWARGQSVGYNPQLKSRTDTEEGIFLDLPL